MKPLTEKQAWLFIAKEFEKKHRTRFNKAGLCMAVKKLVGRITEETASGMSEKIYDETGFCSKWWPFLFPLDSKSKPKRAKLARRFAKECVG